MFLAIMLVVVEKSGTFIRVRLKVTLVSTLLEVLLIQSNCGIRPIKNVISKSINVSNSVMLSGNTIYIRSPALDDQAVFWKLIRRSADPAVLPLDKCRHFNSAQDLQDRQTKSGGQYLVSCVLDTCSFSSGMLSRVYVPEFTYGRNFVIN